MKAAPHHDLLGTIRNDWKIDSMVESGGMGAIYRGTHIRHRTQAAIKVLLPTLQIHPTLVERFKVEAQIGATVSHPNLVHTIDIFDDEHRKYIVMEWLNGETLSKRLKRGPCPLPEAIEIFLGVAAGLSAAHRQGVVHRDIKPGNIFLATTEGGIVPKVLDFGISKLLGDGPQLTRTGAMMGTPPYMSPEQFASTKHVTSQTDIYSLAIVLYEMLTGRNPFIGGSDEEELLGSIALKVSTMPIPPDTRIGADLFDVIQKATHKKASERFTSMDEFSRAVAEVSKNHGLSSQLIDTAITVPMNTPPFMTQQHNATIDSTTVLMDRNLPLTGAHIPPRNDLAIYLVSVLCFVLLLKITSIDSWLSNLLNGLGWWLVVLICTFTIVLAWIVVSVMRSREMASPLRESTSGNYVVQALMAFFAGLAAIVLAAELWSWIQAVTSGAAWRQIAIRREAYAILVEWYLLWLIAVPVGFGFWRFVFRSEPQKV